jgi:anti-anti-sigma factor
MITKETQQTVMKLEGDLVASSVPRVRALLRELVADGIQNLVIDLSNVQMVDSAGLGLLISAHNSIKKVGGQLSVVEASADILELFTTMRIHQHFSVSGR